MTSRRAPYWETERELFPQPQPPATCALCGAQGPLFAGHSPLDGHPIDRCEDMLACRGRAERKGPTA
jgi:hypothetical protein